LKKKPRLCYERISRNIWQAMSNPKEKAEELVSKYITNQNSWYLENLVDGLRITHAKQCALIAVDEILECYPAQCPKESYEMEQHIFWQQVKTEIEKL